MRRLAILVFALAVVGCGEDATTLTAPPVVTTCADLNQNGVCDSEEGPPAEVLPDISGPWSGSMTDSGATFIAQVVTFSFVQDAGAYTADWTAAAGMSGNMRGSVEASGRIAGTMTLTNAAGTCIGVVDGSTGNRNMSLTAGSWIGACLPIPSSVVVVLRN